MFNYVIFLFIYRFTHKRSLKLITISGRMATMKPASPNASNLTICNLKYHQRQQELIEETGSSMHSTGFRYPSAPCNSFATRSPHFNRELRRELSSVVNVSNEHHMLTVLDENLPLHSTAINETFKSQENSTMNGTVRTSMMKMEYYRRNNTCVTMASHGSSNFSSSSLEGDIVYWYPPRREQERLTSSNSNSNSSLRSIDVDKSVTDSDSGMDIESVSSSSCSRSFDSLDSCRNNVPSSRNRTSFSSDSYLNNQQNSMFSSLGNRPECIGQEHSPLKRRYPVYNTYINDTNLNSSSINATDMSLTYNSGCKSLLPNKSVQNDSLEFGWDNSLLDASCTTCGTIDNTGCTKSLSTEYSHASCCRSKYNSIGSESNSNFNSVSSHLYESINTRSSVSEHSTHHYQSVSNEQLEGNANNTKYTTNSDRTQFMTDPICKSAVTVCNTMTRDKKKTLGKKLRKVGKYLTKLNSKEGFIARKTDSFKTLAIV